MQQATLQAGVAMASIRIGECISAGIAGLKKDPLAHIAATLIVGTAGSVSFGVLSGPLMVGYMRMIDKAADGEKAQIGEVFKGFDYFIPALIAFLIGTTLMSIGYVLCVIPGLLLMALTPMALYLIAQGETDGVNAIKRGWAMLKPNIFGAFFCLIVLSLVSSLGMVACLIGYLVTLPIAFIGMHHMSKQMAQGVSTT